MRSLTEENTQQNMRAKRVRRLKKWILTGLFLLILLPTILCMFLFFRLDALEKQILLLEQQQIGQTTEEEFQENKTQPSLQPIQEIEEESTQEVELLAKDDKDPSQIVDRRVYLTFDDGPSAYTHTILDILANYGVKATFFVIGKEDAIYAPMYRRIVEDGHTLGMHSYSHQYGEIYNSLTAFTEDMNKLQAFLQRTTGVTSATYRFPGGSSNSVCKTDMQDLIQYLDEQGIQYYDWNIASGDATNDSISVQEIVQNSLKRIESKEDAVILLHDAVNKKTTVEALPILIEKILEMENTVILPITEETTPIQHRKSER